MSTQAGGQTDPALAAVRAIWAQRREEVIARVDIMEEAITDALMGDLGDELRGRAAAEAHRLAGTVGSFGFEAASAYAREIELALKAAVVPGPDELQRLAELVVGLRHDLESDEEADPLIGSSQAAPAPSGPVDVLVLAMDPQRGRRIAIETAARGLVAVFAVDAEDAHRALSSTPPPRMIVLEATGEKSLVMLERAAARAPTIVLAAPGAVDRVDVARRGGRGLLECQSTIVEIVDAAVSLGERVRSAGITVLAVDDDAVSLDILSSTLSAAGLLVETCADPALFWDRLGEVAPDLVIVDYDMPGIMGSDLARSMRNDLRYQTLPIMFLTAYGDGETVRRIFEAGADDYLTKPSTGPELLARISNRLERVRLLRALADIDPLTGLANRGRSIAAIETQLAMARRAGELVYVAVLDIDDFRGLNDHHGREVGDAVLRALGVALRDAFRGEDVVFRGDGDEFVIAMYGMQEFDARERVGALLESVREHELPGGVRVTLSAGLAGFPRDGQAVETLYRAASRAMRRAKTAGRDRVRAADDVASDDPETVDVVLVEDDGALAALLRESFQTRGYAVHVIEDGDQALAQLGGAHPAVAAAVIILDWDLPGLEGIDVLRSLAAGGLLDRSRVIMLTARTSEREVLQALEAGAIDHVAKPFSVPVLMQRVRRAMDR